MKTTLSYLIISFCFSIFGLNAQTIKLNLEEGHEYVFEKVRKHYSIKEDGTKIRNSEITLEYKLLIEKAIPDSIVVFTLNFIKNINDGSVNGGLIDKTDMFFPAFNEHSSSGVFPNQIDPALIALKCRFAVQLKTGEIAFVDRAEILEGIYDRLREKEYSEKEVKSKIKYLNERGIDNQIEHLEFLTWFLNSPISEGKKILNNKSNEKFTIKEQKGSYIVFGSDFNKSKTGETEKQFRINTENGIITKYSTVKVDSVKSRTEKMLYNNVFRTFETNFRLVYAQKVPVEKVVIVGKIENPLSDKIHVRFLDKPFGTNLKNKTVLLNQDNSFKTTIPLSHKCLIFIENENKNKHNPPATFVFYAEPGDTISFKSTGVELPWATTFNGSNPKASELLHSIRLNIRLPSESVIKSRSSLIFEQMRITGYRSTTLGSSSVSVLSPILPDIFKLLKESEQILDLYQPLLSAKAYNFIRNETNAYFYNALYDNARFELRQFGWNGNRAIKSPKEYSPELLKVEKLNVHEVYNDYGLHSRLCVGNYINYKFAKSNKISQRFFSSSGEQSASEIELKTQFSRMMLTGSPLYRELGKTYHDIIVKRRPAFPGTSQNKIQEKAIDGLEMIARLCNDNEIVHESQQTVAQYQKLKNEDYIPPLRMLDINGSEVNYNDAVKGKPTIFCFSTNWIGSRYEIDQQAAKNTDLKFVFVVEGTSLEQWQQYTERAVPNAEQLLFFNEKQSLNSIFHDNEVYLIFNKEGKFIEYGRGLKGAISVAKESLHPKEKELNKSQLQLIIIVLLIFLTALIIGLTIWKWRVRQRFRKEAQNRKLRELELTAIRSQMNPHFLFNSLNSVQNLVQQNKGREAHLYLADFAGLIRKVLNNSEKEEVSLAEELEMIKQYLNLEKLRFDFTFTVSVADEIDSHNTLVPSMLLQPFVENAVIHGLQSKDGNKQLNVEISKSDSGIKICIEDNGIGREAAKQIAKVKNGKGTKLMKERLEILQKKQGEKYSLETIDLEEGTRVVIVIPEEN